MPLFNARKYAKLAKGYQGRAKNCARPQYNKVQKGLQYSYRERHRRPRLMRQQWILNINSAVREHNINYSRFIFGLNWSNLLVNRKILQDLAINEPYTFKAVVDEVKIQGKLKEKPAQEVTLMNAYEKGLLANSDQIWYKKVEQQAYRFGGLKDPDNLTEETIKHLKKN